VSLNTFLFNQIIGIKVSYENEELVSKAENFLLVSNHLSYLDIFSYSQKVNLGYITSVEMKHTFGLGLVLQLAGCVFVERRRDKRLLTTREGELKDIEKSLDSKLNISLFPEATSTNGAEILSFKKPMYIPAYKLGKTVLVACIRYNKANGQKIDASNRDMVCWYGDMDFAPHFLSLLKQKRVEATVTFIKALDPKDFTDIDSMIEVSRNLIVNEFTPYA